MDCPGDAQLGRLDRHRVVVDHVLQESDFVACRPGGRCGRVESRLGADAEARLRCGRRVGACRLSQDQRERDERKEAGVSKHDGLLQQTGFAPRRMSSRVTEAVRHEVPPATAKFMRRQARDIDCRARGRTSRCAAARFELACSSPGACHACSECAHGAQRPVKLKGPVKRPPASWRSPTSPSVAVSRPARPWRSGRGQPPRPRPLPSDGCVVHRGHRRARASP